VVVVPSGKITTPRPRASSVCSRSHTRAAARALPRCRNSVPLAATMRPTSGQAATSALHTKVAGTRAWITNTSSQDT
jgi:hypothetical protein